MKIFKRCLPVTLALLVLLQMASCKKNNESLLGATLKAASDDFTAGPLCAAKYENGVASMTCAATGDPFHYNANNPTQNQLSYFHCDFNQEVSWTITIKGRISNAVKTIRGTSVGLPFGNVISLWKGNADGFRFFEKDETCDVTISFMGSNETRSTTLKIGNTDNQSAFNYGSLPNVQIIDNFDGRSAGKPMTYSYVDAADGSNNAIYLERESEGIKPVDGLFMLRLKGKDLNGNTYLGGTGPELLTSHAEAFEKLIPLCENDPSKLYVNLYIYGTGLVNSNVQIRAYEIDNLDACTNVVSGGVYPIAYTNAMQATNDQWYSDVYVNWTGWKLVSVPYSSFKPARNPSIGGGGNHIREPRKITSLGLLLQSMPNAGADVNVLIDFITISWGAPLNQVKF